MSITIVNTATVICHTCKQPTPQADAWLVHLIVPSGIYRNGREMWLVTDESARVCGQCYFQEEETSTVTIS